MCDSNQSVFKEVSSYVYSVEVTEEEISKETVKKVCEANSDKLLKGIISDRANSDRKRYYFIFEQNPYNEIEFDYLIISLKKAKQTPFEDFLTDFTRKITEYPLFVLS